MISWVPEPFTVVQTAEAHRNFWKPEKVKLLLLAESHVYASAEDNAVNVCIDALDQLGCPNEFIKLVYCLGYGDNRVLSKPILKNPGTPQYWELFKTFAKAFAPEFNNFDDSDYTGKIAILQSLKENGIWLLDSCPIALYRYDTNGTEIKKVMSNYNNILKLSWQMYSRNELYSSHPEQIIVIGRMVWKALRHDLPKGTDWVYQPNAPRDDEYYQDTHAPTPDILQRMMARR